MSKKNFLLLFAICAKRCGLHLKQHPTLYLSSGGQSVISGHFSSLTAIT